MRRREFLLAVLSGVVAAVASRAPFSIECDTQSLRFVDNKWTNMRAGDSLVLYSANPVTRVVVKEVKINVG